MSSNKTGKRVDIDEEINVAIQQCHEARALLIKHARSGNREQVETVRCAVDSLHGALATLSFMRKDSLQGS